MTAVKLDSSGLFNCTELTGRHTGNLRLTPSACATMWRASRRAKPWQSSHACRGCPIGALHANCGNEAAAYAANTATAVASDQTCLRCGKAGRRMLGGGALCASCHARVGEALRGFNSKHTVPKAARELRYFSGAVTQHRDDKIESASARALVGSFIEFISLTIRHRPDAELGWPPLDQPFFEAFERTRMRGKPKAYQPIFSTLSQETRP